MVVPGTRQGVSGVGVGARVEQDVGEVVIAEYDRVMQGRGLLRWVCGVSK